MTRALVVLGLLVALATPAFAGRDFENSQQDTLETTDSACFPAGLPITIACWWKPESDTGNYQDLVRVHTGTGTHWIENKASLYAYASVESGGAAAGTSNSSTVGSWNHVVGIFTSTTSRRCVLNGNWASSGTNATNAAFPSVSKINIGCPTTVTTEEPDGVITMVAIWSVALTQQEVESLAGWNGSTHAIERAALPWQIRPTSIILLLPLDGRNGANDEYDLRTGARFVGSNDVAAYVDDPICHRRPAPYYSMTNPYREQLAWLREEELCGTS